jgi:hypothetical protein
MKALSNALISLVLSVVASVGLTLAMRYILTSVMEKRAGEGAGSDEPGTGEGDAPAPPVRRPRGPVINPVNVMVFMPIIVGNSRGWGRGDRDKG